MATLSQFILILFTRVHTCTPISLHSRIQQQQQHGVGRRLHKSMDLYRRQLPCWPRMPSTVLHAVRAALLRHRRRLHVLAVAHDHVLPRGLVRWLCHLATQCAVAGTHLHHAIWGILANVGLAYACGPRRHNTRTVRIQTLGHYSCTYTCASRLCMLRGTTG